MTAAKPALTVELNGTSRSRTLHAYVTRKLRLALAVLRVGPIAARAAFDDQNGPKGGVADRCALTVRLPYRPAIGAEHTAALPRAAFDGAFDALERMLARYRERERDRRRLPKKYFAARRALAGDLARPPRSKRMRRRPSV
jgi:ribosome-associated translation inhibitor RaiA